MTLALVNLAAGLALLYFGAESLVRGSSSLALRLGLSPLVVGLTIVAFGTSSPELFVSLRAALNGQAAISVGNVVGSNICNIGLILGLCALITPITITSQIVRIDIPIMLGVTALSLALLADSRLGRMEGIVLFTLLLAYIIFSIRLARRRPADALVAEFGEEVKISKRGLTLDLLMVAVGLALLLFGARFLVDGAIIIAVAFGWSEALIGLTIVAVGTSLPELATSLLAAAKKESDIAVGNIIGSNIFNLLGILGITAVVHPLVTAGIDWIDLAVMAGFSLLLWPMAFLQQRISRPAGALLLASYLAYLFWLVRSA
ncbi:MAG: calcium/sodium antiporter [Akkermansiaceae bacterium]